MSTPDKKSAVESLDSRRNWRSASINSCFLAWTREKLMSETQLGRNTIKMYHQYRRPLLDCHYIAPFASKHCRESLSQLFKRRKNGRSSHSRGVLMPSAPSSRPPTTGTKSRESNMPITRRESEAISKSTASCAIFAVDTTGYLVSSMSTPCHS